MAVPLDGFKANLREMIELVTSKNISVIVIGPTLHEHTDDPDDTRTSQRNLEFSEAAKSVSAELDVPFVDLWNAFAKEVGWKTGDPFPGDEGSRVSLKHLLADGIHFAGDGYRVLYRELKNTIADHYPELVAERNPMLFPGCDEIDGKNIEQFLKQWTPPQSHIVNGTRKQLE
jgi:lysophospholipase L1-like esterase